MRNGQNIIKRQVVVEVGRYMIDERKYAQYGVCGLTPRGIIIHNTNSDMTALELFDWLENVNKGSNACHFLVDHNGVIEVIPLDWKLWTTGKGNDWAFNNCIAVEICSSRNDEDYLEGERIAVNLIKNLMDTYGLTTDDIYFHIDFNERTYCPKDILDRYVKKKNFIERYWK